MIDDYINNFYKPEQARSKFVTANNYAKAKELAVWKEDTAENWYKFEVEKMIFNGQDNNNGEQMTTSAFIEGEKLKVEIVIDKKGMKGDLGSDLVMTKND